MIKCSVEILRKKERKKERESSSGKCLVERQSKREKGKAKKREREIKQRKERLNEREIRKERERMRH